MATQAELQAAIDQLQLNIARIQAFTNDLTGTLNVAIDGGTIPSLMKVVNTVLSIVPVKGYDTEAHLLVDLTPGDKTIAYAGDTENEFIKSGAPNAGTWVPTGNSKLAQAFNFGRNASRYADDLYQFTALPKPFPFEDLTAGALVYQAGLSNPLTRFATVFDANGMQVTGLSGIGATPLPIGRKVLYDALPGDQYAIKFSYTAGTPDSSCGFWFGVDDNAAASISANAKTTVFRNHTLLAATNNGITGDGTRTVTPTWAGSGGALTVGAVYLMTITIQNDRSMLVRVFKDGIQQFTDVVVSSPGPNGSVIFGMNLLNGMVARMSSFTKVVYPGNLVYVDSGVTTSGTGTLGSPLKYFYEVAPAVRNLRLYGKPVTIQMLDEKNYGDAALSDAVARKWDIIGKPGGRTIIDGAQPGEVIVWTLLAGSTKTYTTPLKHNNIVVSFPNSVYIVGQATTALNATHILFPDTNVPATVTPVKTNMDLLVNGGTESSGGLLYLRMPDSTPGGLNPSSSTLIVARVNSVIQVVGSPEVNIKNITLRHSAEHNFTGGSGTGTLNRVFSEWSGYNGNGFEEYNGSFDYVGCKAKYIGNDCFGRSPRIDMPFSKSNRFISRMHDCEASHTIQGDGVSHHVINMPLIADANINELWMTNCRVHDCNKCGVVTSVELCLITGGRITRCGNEQLSIIFPITDASIGRSSRMYVSGVTIDPEGIGLNAVRSNATAGCALALIELLGCHIGQPDPLKGGSSEWNVTTNALAGQTVVPANNVIRFRACTTTRPPGSVVKIGDTVGGLIVPAPAYAAA